MASPLIFSLLLLFQLSRAQCFNGIPFDVTQVDGGLVNVTDITTGECIQCPWDDYCLQDPADNSEPSYVAAQALMFSALSDNLGCVNSFLHSKLTPIDPLDENHRSAIFECQSRGCVDLFINYGANIEVKTHSPTQYGFTPMMIFTAMSNITSARALLNAGAAVCTWPVNIFNIQLIDEKQLFFTIYAASMATTAPCEPGLFVNGDTCESLVICPEGYFCPGYTGQTNSKIPCPVGTYGPTRGAYSITQCRPCPPERPFSEPSSKTVSDCFDDLMVISDTPNTKRNIISSTSSQQ